MAEVQGEVRAQSQARDVSLLKKHATIEILSINDGDTHTVNSLTTIDSAKVIDLSDSTDVTVDIATNVITINDSGVSTDHLIILVVGS